MAVIDKPAIEVKPVSGFRAKAAAPPSKAYTLRALFIASLAEGRSVLRNALFAEDQKYAAQALNDLGVAVERKGNDFVVEGGRSKLKAPEKELFLGNSGVSVRFLISLVALPESGTVVINGNPRMQKGRPSQDLLDALANLGVQAKSVHGNGCPPIEVVCGTLAGGETKLKGDVSSQYFSSMLIAAPYAKKDVTVVADGELRSKPYIDLTLDCMNSFGVKAENENYERFTVGGGQAYKPQDYAIEGDYSNAAYFFAAAAITKGKVKVSNLNPKSAQGDIVFVELLEQMGCKVNKGKDFVEVEGASLNAITVDMGDYPDLVPPLAVVASFAEGKSKFTNIAHLRYKESDRIQAVTGQLKKCNVNAEETEDSLAVAGTKEHKGAEIETFNDHRIAMSFSVLGLAVPGMRILNPKAVAKSFPDFYTRMAEAVGQESFA